MNAMVNSPGSFEIRRTFSASRERVFAAWTLKESLEQWMCRDVPSHRAEYLVLDVRPGGRYVIEIKLETGVTHRGRGVFREVKPPERLVFTWSWETFPAGDEPSPPGESLVTVELFARGSSTELVLTHEFPESDPERLSSEEGWKGCFEVLATVLGEEA